MNLLMGVSAQLAVNIVEAISFQKLQESEKKYRDLVENANSIILRMNTDGFITFFNEFAQKLFGYSEDDLKTLDPYARLEALQGEQNTYYLGSLFNGELTNYCVEYAESLISKHFG